MSAEVPETLVRTMFRYLFWMYLGYRLGDWLSALFWMFLGCLGFTEAVSPK